MTRAHQLSCRSDADLLALFEARPDLVEPYPPATFDELAERAGSIVSLARCLRTVDLFLARLTEIVAVHEASVGALPIPALVGPKVSGEAVEMGLARLHLLGLVVDGTTTEVRLPGQLRRRLSHPAGLGAPVRELLVRRSHGHLETVVRALGAKPEGDDSNALADAAARILTDRDAVADLLTTAPDESAALIRSMAQDGEGVLAESTRSPEASPAAWLVEHGLLIGEPQRQYELPLEIGLMLRGDVVYPDVTAEPPALVERTVPNAILTSGAADAAISFVRNLGALLREIARQPVGLVKKGGIGVKELRRLVGEVDLDERKTAALVELAGQIGLIGTTTELGLVAPTPVYDVLRELPPAQQWLAMVDRWWEGDRHSAFAGWIDLDGSTIRPLSSDHPLLSAADQRRRHLSALSELEPGSCVTDGLVERLRWQAPVIWDDEIIDSVIVVDWLTVESELLGLTVGGGASDAGRALSAGDRGGFADWAIANLPDASTAFVLQADLTAVAAGTLAIDVAEFLERISDVESRGGATTYRFSPSSIARGLDVGLTAAEIADVLVGHSGGALPQPLERLITDTADRHGRVRVRPDGSVRPVDDETLASIAGDPKLAPLLEPPGSDVQVTRVLTTLRKRGHLAVAEDDDGRAIIARRSDLRLPAEPADDETDHQMDWYRTPTTTDVDLVAVVAELRAGPQPEPPVIEAADAVEAASR